MNYPLTATGSSTDPCDFSYCGVAPFSEPETANQRDLLSPLADNVDLLLTFHTYSQKWLVPWAGYEDKPEDYDQLVLFTICLGTQWDRPLPTHYQALKEYKINIQHLINYCQL